MPVDAGFAEGVDHGNGFLDRVGVGGFNSGNGGNEGEGGEGGERGEGGENVSEGGWKEWEMHFGGGVVGVSLCSGSLLFGEI